MSHLRALPKSVSQALVVQASIVGLVGALLGAPANASPDTLRLALEDITMGTADVLASPVTGGIATADNLDAVSDATWLQAVYAVPGWLGLTFLQAGQGSLRVLVGALELVPGIVLFPFPDTDVPEDFNVFRQGALVDAQNPLGKRPTWLPYVLPVTPITIDARVFPVSPWAVYLAPQDDTFAGDPSAWASNDE
jgi:hypothetical protein